jgi:phenylalanyl-tRNA synthetase alpha chain
MNASEILGSLSYQERKVLLALAKLGDGASPEGIFEAGPFGQMVEVMNAASWLQSKGLITMEERGQKVYGLKAKDIAQRGLP